VVKAWALGAWEADDPIAQVWRKAADAHLVPVEQTNLIGRTIPRLNAHSLVLLRHGLDITNHTIEALVATSARLIVYVPEGAREVAPTKAVELCTGSVLTVVHGRDGLPHSLARRLERMYADHHMYREIHVPAQAGERYPKDCFVACPYSSEGEGFFEAARAALEARGLRIKDPRRFLRPGILNNKITEMIEDVDFVVADTRGINRNVWLEIGLALGKNKPTILSTLGESSHDAIASDVHGVELLKFWDVLDLTMKLYWGFRWVASNGRPKPDSAGR
jgi:hypothetical protein